MNKKTAKKAAPPKKASAAAAAYSEKSSLGKPPAWFRAQPLVLPEGTLLDDAIAAVVGTCRNHWLANTAAAVDGRDPEGVHQVRVALRRLRSGLSLFKKHIPVTQRQSLNQEAKWLLTQLGPVRDLDVFIHVLAADFAPRTADDEGFAHLVRAARTNRDQAQRLASEALASARARRFATRLEVWLQGHGWRGTVASGRRAHDFAKQVVNRRLRRVRAAAEGIAGLSVEERHDLRIAVKKTRYGIEFFAGVLPAKRAARLTAALKHVQDSLGRLNDLNVAERTIGRLSGANAGSDTARAAKTITRAYRKAAAAAEPEIRKQCRRLTRIALF